jgi:hypothetical protein
MLLALMLPTFTVAEAADATGLEKAALPQPVTADASLRKISSDLRNTPAGPVVVTVRFKGQPGALGGNKAQIQATQDRFASTLGQYGATELARFNMGLNGMAIRVDAANLTAIAKDYDVASIKKVNNYSIEVSPNENVGLIGGDNANAAGYDGTGTTVAVMDSGIDYTHKALGGPGTVADYNTCYAQKNVAPSGSCAALFGPGAPKVIGGYDFVGETWPNTSETPDPNPIDFEGHGTHVSDIIAGVNGVAPKAKVVSIKVCSAVSTSCSGIAILNGIEFILNWNATPGKPHIDVVNLSLGSDWGQDEDDSTAALENVYLSGVVVVAAAGNAANKPYIVSSPSIGRGVISVAQTAVASDALYPLQFTGTLNTLLKYSVLQPWSPTPTSALTGPVQYGDGAGGNLNGCAAFPAGSLTGKVLLIDRGTCAVSIKGSNGSAAGAKFVIVANNAPGEPPSFSYGGGTVTVPVVIISQSDGTLIKSKIPGVNATLDPANKLPIVETMVSSSSRGPKYSNSFIKPEIGAPGASNSAEVGTGDALTAFGGTSGATPMVAGSALLVTQAYPNTGPVERRARLMNNAETNIYTLDLQANKYLSPITRIGAGEVRVDKAIQNGSLAYEATDQTAALSLGYQVIGNSVKTITKTIRIQNTTNVGRTYTFTPTFRYADDQALGAVTVNAPSVYLGAGAIKNVTVKFSIDGNKLKPWPLTGKAGQFGNDGTVLDGPEIDGYLVIDGGAGNKMTMPWHVLPHKGADLKTGSNGQMLSPGKTVTVTNTKGAIDGAVDVFQLMGDNGLLPTPSPQPGDNFSQPDLRAFGVREVGPYLQFAVNTYGTRALPVVPAEFDVYVDTNNDGVADYVIFNSDATLFASHDGRTLAFVQKLGTTTANAYFYAIQDFNSGNLILTVPASALGLTSGKKFGSLVEAEDNYFTGLYTDYLPGNGVDSPLTFATYTLGQPRYGLTLGSNFTVLKGGSVSGKITEAAGSDSLSNSNGLFLMYSDNPTDREADLIYLNFGL